MSTEENFWDDRTTPGAYGKSDSDRDMAARRASIAEPHKLIAEAVKWSQSQVVGAPHTTGLLVQHLALALEASLVASERLRAMVTEAKAVALEEAAERVAKCIGCLGIGCAQRECPMHGDDDAQFFGRQHAGLIRELITAPEGDPA